MEKKKRKIVLNGSSTILNLRTIIVIVSAITTLSVIYNTIIMQASLLLFSILLLLIIQPSKHRFTRLAHRMKIISRVVVTLMIFQILFRHGGETLWQFGIIKITSLGVNYGVSSSLRLMLIVLIAGLLLDIPYYDYILAFRSWKIPYEISFLVASVIHFIPIFHKQFIVSKEALNLRGIEISKSPIIKRFKIYSALVFPVIARAISEVKYRSISLELRAFRLFPERTFIYEAKLKWYDLTIQIIIFFIFLNILILSYFLI
ncbi:MAG: energy-coupling factor transporter transmembrane protein EcfT [Candidatus Cloacimonetes bacterium]|jgi:energy-coupling factor transport system permease protein|nr:energy-coupling factor transporter transmembrane protein EcfT [Candidatus Cloacimonadota bacterium]MBT4576111.1 energy-coupling factor transporter transmembrane protein EcfT [Candidatus Cloacimonadota bacterium]